MKTYKEKLTFLLFLLINLSGCSLVGTYTPAIQQGKEFPKEVLNKIKPGMNKTQIHYLLMSPNVVDIKDSDKWIYAYTFQKTPDAARRLRTIVLTFRNDRLETVNESY